MIDTNTGQTINFEDFIENKIMSDHFTKDARIVLWVHLMEIERDTGDKGEFDPDWLSQRFIEYDSLEEFNDQQGTSFGDWQQVPDFAAHVGNKGAIVEDVA